MQRMRFLLLIRKREGMGIRRLIIMFKCLQGYHIKKCCESYHHSDMLQSKNVLLLFMNKNEADKMKKMVKMLK
jgi:hypothetical protein